MKPTASSFYRMPGERDNLVATLGRRGIKKAEAVKIIFTAESEGVAYAVGTWKDAPQHIALVRGNVPGCLFFKTAPCPITDISL